jgi:hypothetical protein
MASSTGVVDAAAILTEEVVVAKSRRCAIRALRANIRVMFPVKSECHSEEQLRVISCSSDGKLDLG